MIKKLKSILLSICMLGTVCSFTSCGSKDMPDEAIGTYSVDDVSVLECGKDMGITEFDLLSCTKVEITDDEKIICYGLAGNKKFTISSCSENDGIVSMHTEEGNNAGYDPKHPKVAPDCDLDKDFEGPVTIEYYNDNNDLEVYFKFKGNTNGWHGILKCSKAD